MTEYTRWRHHLGREKFPTYLAYMKMKYPNKDLHHLAGSDSKKFTDALVYPFPHDYHLNYIEKHKAEIFEQYLERSIIEFLTWCWQEHRIRTSLPVNTEPRNFALFVKQVHQLTKSN